ncbi:hypothetical protein MLD52_13525 [Puniceicoccaceae bacterium K14]|nr:hypothetical protein [Puniceicoccaceae bacterium K14]
MQLSLFQATFFVGIVFLAFGVSLLLNLNSVSALLRSFPRSRRAAYVTMIIGGAWTLYGVTQLGEADFGNFKQYIFIGFLLIGIGAFKYSPDFLSVRGACIIYLLMAYVLLQPAYMQYEKPLRLLMVTPVYMGIALSVYLAHSPFRVRDFFNWLFLGSGRTRIFGLAFAGYGALLSGVAFSF